jgi:small subunit ribosomal protein S21
MACCGGLTITPGASPRLAECAGLMDFPALFCYMRRQGGAGGYAHAASNPANLTARGASVQVLVRDNNVDQALKALKKKMQREGIFREMKLRGHYEKPSEKKAREKAEAIRRARKLARKRLQREGLLPMKPKPTGPGGLGGPGGPGTGRSGPSRAPRFG